MRKILFRGKRLDNGEWAEGSYFVHHKRQPAAIGDSLKDDDIVHLIIRNGFADWNMPRSIDGIPADPATVGQYTGLLDKNGVKVYEGDIVTDHRGTGLIVWSEKYAQFALELECRDVPKTYERFDISTDSMAALGRVIGNRWDNPGLLEVNGDE